MPEPLRLTKPVLPFSITQRFGEDLTCIDLATRSRCVLKERDTCPVGYESLYIWKRMRGHNGLDLAAEHRQPVYTATDGFVHEVVAEKERGIGVEIVSHRRLRLEGMERPYRVKTRYWHLFAYGVLKGQKVHAGQVIGWAGSTGLSTGNHLHFELKPVRRNWRGRWKNVFQDNGHFGAVDPYPYFRN